MTDNELALCRAITDACWCDLSQGPSQEDGKGEISGAFIRRLILGRIDAVKPQDLAFGIRLRRARIEGVIDLRDAAATDYGPLPPLLLEDCELLGDEAKPTGAVLIARHSHLTRLSLSRSKIGRIDLADALLEGDLAIDEIGPINESRSCQVSARGAQIHGRVNARGAFLRIPQGQRIPDFDIRDFALDFTDARIDSTLYLCPGFEAIGGVKVGGASIGADIWCLGAKLTANGKDAFSAQSLSCRGVVSFESTEESSTRICGAINLLCAEVGTLVISSVHFRKNPLDKENAPDVYMTYAHIRDTLHIDGIRKETGEGPACEILADDIHVGGRVHADRCSGVLRLNGSEIGGNLSISSAKPTTVPGHSKSGASNGPQYGCQILANGVRIAGDLIVAAFRGDLSIQNAEISGRIEVGMGGNTHENACHISYLNFDGLTVNGHMHFDATGSEVETHFSARNLDVGEHLRLILIPAIVTLDGSRVRNDLNIRMIRHSSADGNHARTSATNIEVGHNLCLENSCGSMNLSTARVNGRLSIKADNVMDLLAQDIEVRGPVSLDGLFSPTQPGHGVNFDGATCGGEFHINNVVLLNSTAVIPSISLRDASIGRDLRVTSVTAALATKTAWIGRTPDQVCVGALDFYPGWMLCEARFDLDKGPSVILAFLYSSIDPQEAILLPGKVTPVHELNERGALRLNDVRTVEHYLRFFCNVTWSDLGAFHIVDSVEDIGMILDSQVDAKTLNFPVRVTPAGDRKWNCEAVVQYGDHLFSAKFVVSADGSVSMTDDSHISDLHGEKIFSFDAPLRILGPGAAGREKEKCFWVKGSADAKYPEDMDPYESMLDSLSGGEQLSDRKASAVISLTGSRSGAMRFATDGSGSPMKMTWGEGVLVELEGFEYGRLEIEDAYAKQFSKATSEPGLRAAGAGAMLHSVQRWWRNRKKADPNLAWLGLQFPDGVPTFRHPKSRFSPQPHEHLAGILRTQGKVHNAAAVTVQSQRLERKLVLGWFRRQVNRFMDTFFCYGFEPFRGVLFCAMWLMGGVLLFDYFNYGYLRWLPASENWPIRIEEPILVVDSTAVSTLMGSDRSGFGNPGMVSTEDSRRIASENLRCGDQVDVVLYPVELFIPLLDLGQQQKCTITSRPSAFIARWVRAGYMALGAVFTSLTLLSIAGVLKRRIES